MAKIAIGRIINTHGLKGEVKIESWSDFDDERYHPGSIVYLAMDDKEKEMTMASYRRHKGFPLVSFAGYSDINMVECFRGCEILIEETERAVLAEGEYYFDDLIGLKAFDEEGRELGEIIDVEPTRGAQNNLRLAKLEGGQALIPFVPAFIVSVDMDAGIIVIHVIEGLL